MLGVVTLVFILFFVLLPADPARLTMGQRSDQETIDNVRKELYLDKPLLTQFAFYLNDLSPISIHRTDNNEPEKYAYHKLFSLGENKALCFKAPYMRRSYQSKILVWDLLWDAFPGTFILAVLSIFIATTLGIFLGVVSAIHQNTWLDTSAIFASILGISAPSFFAGILIAYVFGFLFSDWTGLNIISPLWDYDPLLGKQLILKSLILPVLTLSLRPMAIITQITRTAMLDVLNQDFIRTAYAKGLSRRAVIWKHALRNALNPVVTSISRWFAELLAGSFFIEFIFGWKGIGKLTVDALNKFDFPVVMGSVLFTAGLFILINILVDLLYKMIDPRIRL